MRHSFAAFVWVLCASSVSAQVIVEEPGDQAGAGQTAPPPAQPQQPYGAQPQQPYGAQPAPAVQPAAPERLLRQLSGYLSVPIVLTDGTIYDSTLVRADEAKAGFGIHGRFGWELGLLVLEGAVGWKIFAVDGPRGANLNLQDLWVGLGTRLQFLNRSRVVPFASAAFVLNFLTVASGTARADYEFNPGAQVALGVAIELTRNLGLEAAVSGDFIFPIGDVLQRTQVALQPWVGATLYL